MNDFIVSLYDEYVRHEGSEVKSSEAMSAIHPQVVDFLAQQERDLDSEADRLISHVVGRSRDSRRTSLKRDLEWLLDGAFDEDGAYLDPILDRAYGLGRVDGADKTLRNWTADDFDHLIKTHYRVAADQTAAAAAFDETAERIKERMLATGADTLGSVEWSS